jgi:hypothetical protein
MASTDHMATEEDDRRHKPGPDSLPLWNESYWFAFYDPKSEIGVTVRMGMHPNKPEGNLYLLFAQGGEIVHGLVDARGPVPPWEENRLALHGYSIDIESPPDRFRLRYEREGHAMDVVWQGYSPTYLYPVPPDSTSDQIPRHIEHAGVVTGTVTIAGKQHQVDCLGHRDHSWGGERDWSKMPRWDYLSGEIGKDFWFNAVEVSIEGFPQAIYRGGLWDGKEVLDLAKVEMEVQTTDGGTRQVGVDLKITDERGREHHIVGEKVLAIAPAWFGRTWVKDGFTRYRYGDRVGYGILEHGYIEED